MTVSLVHPSPMIHLNNSRTARDFLWHAVEPSTSDVHLLIQRDTANEVNKCEHGVQIAHLPDYPPVSMLGVDSGSTHRKSELGASIGQREDVGFGVMTMLRIYCVSVIWTLEPGDFTTGGVVRLSGWSKNCIELISAYPFNICIMKYHLKRENK